MTGKACTECAAASSPLALTRYIGDDGGMKVGNAIILNGASSSGKSSIAKLLQGQLSTPYLHFEIDKFASMLPDVTDELWLKMTDGFNKSILSMMEAGNNLIVDHVLLIKPWLEDCLRYLHDKDVTFVGLHCPLEELERREAQRDARRQGFAKSQFPNIHKRKIYDIELDTSRLSVEECCERIIDFCSSGKPRAFEQMFKAYRENGDSLPLTSTDK